MLISTKKIFQKSYGKYGVAAVNVWCMEQILALFSAAQKANAPFIVQTSPAARNYASPEMLISMISTASRIYPNTVFAFHLDQGTKTHVWDSINSGAYNSVMVKASNESFDTNVELTREIVKTAHKKEITVEAEFVNFNNSNLNARGNEDISLEQSVYLEKFIKHTNCDSIAVALGTSFGAYKFSEGTKLQLNILKEIQKRIPGFPLVLQGGSAIKMDEIQRINASGGQIGTDARGISDEEILRAIDFGICKINIETDSRLIWTRVHREFFKMSPAKYDPICPGASLINALIKFNLEKFELFRAVGKADELKLL